MSLKRCPQTYLRSVNSCKVSNDYRIRNSFNALPVGTVCSRDYPLIRYERPRADVSPDLHGGDPRIFVHHRFCAANNLHARFRDAAS